MKELCTNIAADFQMIFICYTVLLLAIAANIVLSLYYNISISKEIFETKRLIKGVKKAIVLMLGTLLMVASVDAATIWLTQSAVNINEQTHEFSTVAMIAATIGVAAWRYIKDAYQTFIHILNSGIVSAKHKKE